MTKYSYLTISEKDIDSFNQLCPPNEYRIYAPYQIEQSSLSFVPPGLWIKSDSLFIMSSGSTYNTAYCMVNCNRYDPKARAIDQEPICFAYVGNKPIHSGIIIHHGNWIGRTQPIPTEFLPYLAETGLGNYYPMKDLPTATAGTITNVNSVGQIGAFDTGVKKIIQMSQSFPKS